MVLESDVSGFPRCTTSGDVLDGALIVTENNGCAGRGITQIRDQLTKKKDFLADGRDSNVFSFTSGLGNYRLESLAPRDRRDLKKGGVPV